jgi:hypothetical protein
VVPDVVRAGRLLDDERFLAAPPAPPAAGGAGSGAASGAGSGSRSGASASTGAASGAVSIGSGPGVSTAVREVRLRGDGRLRVAPPAAGASAAVGAPAAVGGDSTAGSGDDPSTGSASSTPIASGPGVSTAVREVRLRGDGRLRVAPPARAPAGVGPTAAVGGEPAAGSGGDASTRSASSALIGPGPEVSTVARGARFREDGVFLAAPLALVALGCAGIRARGGICVSVSGTWVGTGAVGSAGDVGGVSGAEAGATTFSGASAASAGGVAPIGGVEGSALPAALAIDRTKPA